MKINFILPSLKTGGGARTCILLAEELAKLGHEVQMIYANNSEEQNLYGCNSIKLVPIGKLSKFKLIRLFNLVNCVLHLWLTKKNQIIICTDPITSIILLFFHKRFQLYRYIQANDYIIFDDQHLIQSNIALKCYKFFTLKSFQSDVKFIFNSNYTYQEYLNVSSNSHTKLSLVHPAINHNIFFNKQIRNQNQINICIIARSHPWKGFIDFIEAIQILNTLPIRYNNIFILSHDNLDNFPLIDNARYMKPESDEEIAKYLNKSHIFVSTSWWEGFGLPPLEAMACGCAVILTSSGGVNEYAVPDQNCIMIPPKSPKHLSEAIINLIKNPEKIKFLANNSLQTVKNFSWQKSALQLSNILQEN